MGFRSKRLNKARASAPTMPHVVAIEGPLYRKNLTREAVTLREFGFQLIWHGSLADLFEDTPRPLCRVASAVQASKPPTN